MRRPALALLALACAACAPRARTYDRSPPPVALHGEGSTFSQPLYNAWAVAYRDVEPSTTISYSGTGSGAGVDAILANRVAFGGSDPPLDPAKNPSGAIVQIPITLSGVAVAYKLDAFKSTLKLTPSLVARIFQGTIQKWNDPAIAAVNDPATPLPATDIHVVTRSDASGTTTVFTDYLTRTAPEWSSGKKSQLTYSWAKPAPGNDGVALALAATDGSIGYLDYAFVTGAVRAAAVQNHAGGFVAPTLETISAAASAARLADLSKPLLDPPGESSYPIATFSYALVHRDTPDRDAGVALARFFWWAAHDGQRLGPAKGYVTLPPEILVRVESLLQTLRAAGEASLTTTGT